MNQHLLKQIVRISMAALLATSLYSCVDDKYDLSKDIDTDITIGGDYLSLPIGTTDTIFLSKLLGIKDGDIIHSAADGSYMLSISDEINVDIPEIKNIIFTPEDVTLPDVALNLSNIAPRPNSNPITTLYAPVKSSSHLTINASVPNEILSAKSTMFTNNPKVTVTLTLSGSANNIAEIDLMDLRITLPEFFVLNKAADPKTPNQILINESFDPSSPYDITLDVNHFEFGNTPINNGITIIKQPVSIEGNVAVKLKTETGTTPTDLKLSTHMTINGISVGLVEGIINPTYNIENQSTPFDKLPDFLKGPDVVLDVQPRITIGVGNSVGLPVEMAVQITPKRQGAVIQDGVNNISLSILKATTNGEQTFSRLWISKSDIDMPTTFTHVYAPSIGNLVKHIPDQFEFKLKANPDITQNHSIDLSRPKYHMSIGCSVDVPLSFGPELSIAYNDTIKGLNENLDGLTDKIKEMEMLLDIKNTVPLELQLTAMPLDVQGNVISGVEIKTTGAVKAGKIGAVANASLKLNIKQTEPGGLQKLDQVVLEVRATNNTEVKNTPLSQKQFMLWGVKLRIPGGINIK